MKIKRCPLIFNNVISTQVRCQKDEWHLAAREFRNAIIKNQLYATGPVIYQITNIPDVSDEAIFHFYLPINEAVDMPGNDKYSFHAEWKFEDGLVIRHADLDEEMEPSYELLRLTAASFELELQEPFFNIYLDVYGTGIIDIYAPIVKVV